MGLARRHPKWRCILQMSFFCMFLLRLFFPWPYNGRNLKLFSPGCYNEGTKLHFSCFFPWQGHFLRQKAKIGFHSTESNGSFFILPLLVVWVHHLLRKLIHDHLHLIFHHPLLEKWPKMGIREQSYEGHLGFKSTVSPLIFPFGEEERKKKTLINLCGTQSYWKAKRWKN